jgi:flagellar basal body-associated protein FliL
MPDGETENEDLDDAPRKRGARKLLLTVLPLVLIALVVARLAVSDARPPTPAVSAARAAARQHELDTKCAAANRANSSVPGTAATGPTLDLDSKTMNLDGSHYLKVGVSLQLPAKAVVDEVKSSENWASLVSQLVLDTFSGRSFAQLSHDGVREELQHEIGYQTCERTGGKVVTVYFVDFVMQ